MNNPGIRIPFLALLLAAAFFLFRTDNLFAQTAQPEKEKLLQNVTSIQTLPIEILPTADCRLSDIETEIYLLYASQQREVPAELRMLAARKRQEIDFMRSRIDSLYYMQALQAINQTPPDWDMAMENIEKSLLYNRFFTRSVLFKLNYLLKIRKNPEETLRYLEKTLQEFSRPKKIRQTARTVYNTLLQETEILIEKKQYRDALSLYRLIRKHCRPEFPVRYIPYKEKQLENQALQGIFRSYYEVAQKAFDQRQYQLAQQYALQAHDFFTAHEGHMGGINYALELLDRIAGQYHRYAALSDPDEKSFYLALIDSIVNKTGLVVVPESAYDPQADIAADLLLLNVSLHKDTVPAPKKEFVPLRSGSFASTPALNIAQAGKQFGQAWDQANYFRSGRNFTEALAWFERAKELKEKYPLRIDPHFDEIYENTLVMAVEQLTNKAAYYLWTHAEDRADSLYRQAGQIFETFREREPDNTGTITRLQQLLGAWQEKRNASYCESLQNDLDKTEKEFYRQASYGNYALAKTQAEKASATLIKFGRAEYATCGTPGRTVERIRLVLSRWEAYRDCMAKADCLLHENADTLGYIAGYLRADTLFRELGLGAYTPAPPTLFSRLSSSGDLSTLLIWTEYCIRKKDWPQARFLLGYLYRKNYRTAWLDRLSKQCKRGQEKKTR